MATLKEGDRARWVRITATDVYGTVRADDRGALLIVGDDGLDYAVQSPWERVTPVAASTSVWNPMPQPGPRIVEIGCLWLHLPTGAAAINGFVQGPDSGPEVGGALRLGQPVWLGGSEPVFEGLDLPIRFDDYGFNWAHRTTDEVQAEAERRGWRSITRAEAGAMLQSLGYELRHSPGLLRGVHASDVLWLNQLDGLTWHVRESSTGFRFIYERCVFVKRKAITAE